MTERAKKYLFDILFAIEAIDEFMQGFSFSEYERET